jgi:DNA-binding CsgD family transcriptional regulator
VNQARDDVETIAQLYEHALGGAPDAFRTWALQQLAADSGATNAGWLLARIDESGMHPLQLRGLAGAGEPAAALLRTIEARAATARHDALLLGPDDLHGAAGSLLLRSCPHAGTLFSSLLWLERAPGAAAFDASGRTRFDVRAPHAARAALLAQHVDLKLDPTLQQLGRRSRGAACLCDASGAVYAMSPLFGEAVRRHLPQWDGLRLPFAVPARDERGAAQRSLVAGGLHLRVTHNEGLCVLHVRATHPFDGLTKRERDVVNAIVGGRSFKSLARHLGVSPSTVANHASNIYHKLGVYSRDDVVELSRTNMRAQQQQQRV